MGLSEKIFPQWLVELFGEAIGMGTDDGDIAWFRIGIVDWDVLFDVEVYHGLLGLRYSLRVFSDMLSFDNVLDDVKWGRHGAT